MDGPHTQALSFGFKEKCTLLYSPSSFIDGQKPLIGSVNAAVD